MRPTVIFDLDGTLVDTAADLIAGANAALEEAGLASPLDPQLDAATAFRGARAMLRLGLARAATPDEARVETLYPRVLALYGAAIAVHSRPYPGAMGAVEALKAQGFAVGICTNKPEGLALQLMEELALLHHFEALVGADTLPVRKPDPAPLMETVARVGGDPTRTILVGDTETDRETARAAGVPCVLVTFGPEGRAVAALEPEALLDDYAEMPALARRLTA